MSKKIISIVMIALVIMSLCACGSNQTASNGVTTIKFWSGSGAAKSTLEKIVDDYNNGQGKEKGIRVELTISTDNMTNIDVAQQNNQLPDICSPTYTQAKVFTKQGDFVPLENFNGSEEFIKKMNSPAIEERNMYDGKLYGVFTNVQTAGLIYNKDLFKSAGLVDENGEAKPPKTFEELREYAKKLTDPSKSIYGYSFPYKFGTYYTINAPYATSIRKEVTDFDTLTVGPTEFADVFELMMQMRDDGSLFPGAESLDNDTSRAYFAEGKIGMMPAVSWDTGVLTTQFVAKCDWAVAPAPVKDENNKYPAWSAYAGLYFLTKTAMEHPDEAFDFYQYYYSDDIQKMLVEEVGELPINEKLFEGVNVDVHAKQFRALYDENYDTTIYPSYTIEGESLEDLYQKVWAGKITSEQAEQTFAQNKQTALRKAVEDGTVDVTPFQKK